MAVAQGKKTKKLFIPLDGAGEGEGGGGGGGRRKHH